MTRSAAVTHFLKKIATEHLLHTGTLKVDARGMSGAYESLEHDEREVARNRQCTAGRPRETVGRLTRMLRIEVGVRDDESKLVRGKL